MTPGLCPRTQPRAVYSMMVHCDIFIVCAPFHDRPLSQLIQRNFFQMQFDMWQPSVISHTHILRKDLPCAIANTRNGLFSMWLQFNVYILISLFQIFHDYLFHRCLWLAIYDRWLILKNDGVEFD